MTISGNVRNSVDAPLNALVLANGAWTFTNPSDGGFSLTAPLNADGRLTLFSFNDGFSPFKQKLNPSGDLQLNIIQQTAPADAPPQQVAHQLQPDGESNRYRLSGQVSTSDGVPICALILTNGLFQFSCDGAGKFELLVVPDNQGRIGLMSFADGFLPYRETVNTP